MSVDATAVARGFALLRANDVASAGDVSAALLADAPDDPEALKLAASVAVARGRAEEAERLLRAAVERGSESAAAHAGLGEFLKSVGRRDEAAAAFRAAMAHPPYPVSVAEELADLLLDARRPGEALAVAEAHEARATSRLLQLKGLALKRIGRTDDALAAFERAAALGPDDPFAHHNLASVYSDLGRRDEAEASARRALDAGGEDGATYLVLGHAHAARQRFDEAEDAYREAVRRKPLDYSAQESLAQLVWVRTADAGAALASLDETIAVHPADARLLKLRATILEWTGDLGEADATIERALAVEPRSPSLWATAAVIARMRGLPELSLERVRRGAEIGPTIPLLDAACCAQMMLGDAEGALQAAEMLRARAPNDQSTLATFAAACRLAGDPRAQEIYDYDTQVRAEQIETPDGWGSLDAYLDDLREALWKLHNLKTHPVGQSLRGGTQTTERLDRIQDPAVQAFFQAIAKPIDAHVAALGSGTDALRARNTGAWRLEGGWSVKLFPKGFHVNHIHPEGWISSACHIDVPAVVEDETRKEGWLKFGEPPYVTKPPLEPERYVKPSPGVLVMFPSYMWHGTVPFSGDAPRLTIALDIRPAERAS